MSFIKHPENAQVCYTKPLDSLKNWNDHFFSVDASILPLVIPWHKNKTLKKDPPLLPNEYNADVYDYLATNPAPFKKFLEPFLCFVGISRGHVVPLAGVNNQGNANSQDARNNNVNEGGNNVAKADQAEQGDHVVDVGGIDIMADDEIQAIVTDQPKRVRKKRKAANGAYGSGLPPKKLREDHDTSGNAGTSVARKSLASLQGLLESSTLATEVGVMAMATVPFVTSSVTLKPEREGGGPGDSITRPNLRTQHAFKRFAILIDSSHHSGTNVADDEVTSIVRSFMPPPPVLAVAVTTVVVAGTTSALIQDSGIGQVKPSIFRDSASPSTAEADVVGPSQPVRTDLSADSFYVSQDMNLETLRQIYIPKWNVINDSVLDDPEICRGMIDHLAPPGFLSQLQAMDYKQLLAEFSVGAARQACFNAEIRMRLEHELRAAKVNELNDVKARNVALEGQVVALESAVTSKDAELASSNSQVAKVTQDLSNLQLSCDELSVKASSLEFEKDKLIDQVFVLETTCSGLCDEVIGYKLFKEQVEAVQDVQVKVFSDRVAELDANLMGMAVLSLYMAAFRGAIGCAIDKDMQDGLAADIDHGEAGRSLAEVAAYNPAAEAEYVDALNALRVVEFPLLAQLISHKNASIYDLIDLLRLEGPVADTPELSLLQPSPE
ncbi:hypothetical protein Tco_0005379 [Tanacetum coccineum]